MYCIFRRDVREVVGRFNNKKTALKRKKEKQIHIYRLCELLAFNRGDSEVHNKS